MDLEEEGQADLGRRASISPNSSANERPAAHPRTPKKSLVLNTALAALRYFLSFRLASRCPVVAVSVVAPRKCYLCSTVPAVSNARPFHGCPTCHPATAHP